MSKTYISDLINTRIGKYEEETIPPASVVWDGGKLLEENISLSALIRKADLNNEKYDWRKSTPKGKQSHKNFGDFLFNIL